MLNGEWDKYNAFTDFQILLYKHNLTKIDHLDPQKSMTATSLFNE